MQNVLIQISRSRRRMPLIFNRRQFIEVFYYIIVLQEIEVRDHRVITQQPEAGVEYAIFGCKFLDRRRERLSVKAKHQD